MKRSMPRRQFLQAASLAAAAAATTSAGEPPKMDAIREAPRETPVVADVDVCVVGASCTGVFAAVAAARLGAKVALIEANGFFGGVATASLVSVWHSTKDTKGEQQVIGGLTTEVVERLAKRDAVTFQGTPSVYFILNTEELKIELDQLIAEAKVRPFLHTLFVAPAVQDGRLVAAIIEDKTGRRALRAKQFIDATGDADLVARLGLPTYKRPDVQPPTMCAVLRGLGELAKKHKGFNVHSAIFDAKFSQALKRGFAWGAAVPCGNDEYMLAGTRVFGANCADADELTQAELEGRRQVRAICDILRDGFMGGKGNPLVTLPAKIGIRETRHAACLHTLTQDELLSGARFPDAIANGTYPVDIHSARGAGVTFRRLEMAPFYQVPYASLVPKGATNLLIAGRSIDADEGAFGAVRVMVNCNQMGQAAGVAAWLALDSAKPVAEIDAMKLRNTLRGQGAIVL